MRRIDPQSTLTKDLHQYMVGSVAPRPIAFVSTKSADGCDNIAPYSFFNAFSSNPPIVVFSSNRRVRDNTTKDTLANVEANKELVINMVNYDIVRQMSLSSVEFPSDISEFDKTGLSRLASDLVAPYRIAESPIHMECKVRDIITLGAHGGAGHLIICEVVMMHINEEILDGNRINPFKADLMGRMGRSYYVRASGDSISSIYQNILNPVIGYDGLPEHIQKSTILSGNEIAVLAAQNAAPTENRIQEVRARYQELSKENNPYAARARKAKELIRSGAADEALCLLWNP